MTYNSNWLFESHSKESCWHTQSLSVNFIANSCKISVSSSAYWHIFSSAIFKWLTIVKALPISQPLVIFINKISKLINNLPSLPSTHFSPWTVIECLSGCINCIIDIFLCACNSLTNDLFCGRIYNIKLLPSLRVYKFTINEQLSLNLFQFLVKLEVHYK